MKTTHYRKANFILKILLAAVMIFIVGLSTYTLQQEQKYQNEPAVQKINFTGTYQTQDGGAVPLTHRTKVSALKYSNVIYNGHFDADISPNVKILLYMSNIGAEIYQNGKMIYNGGMPGTFPAISKSAGDGWFSFDSPGIRKEDEITIRLYTSNQSNFKTVYDLFIDRIYTGDAGALFSEYLLSDGIPLISGGIMMFVALSTFIALLLLRLFRAKINKAPMYLLLLMLSCGLWLTMYSGILTLLFPNKIIYLLLSTVSIGGIAIFLCLYLMEFAKRKARTILLVVTYFNVLILTVAVIFQGFGIFDGYQIVSYFMIPAFVSIFIGVIAFMIEIFQHKNQYGIILPVTILIIAAAGLFDSVNYIFHLIPNSYGSLVGFGIFALIQYGYIVKYLQKCIQQAEYAQRLEKEQLQSKISIMISQIQPHFLYNSLMAIGSLCKTEPEKAEEALYQFSHYLRGNLDSIDSRELIPFEKELEHIKNYLSLEKMRFDERLNIEYDLETTDFQLPALTVQPIVENAVRYGITKKDPGGTVKISTKRLKSQIVITVADNGKGFNIREKKSDGRSHIGLDNVRTRLAGQCGGTLRIKSTEGLGTTVEIILPKEEIQT